MLCGELLLGTGVRRFGWVPRHRASPHPPDSFAVSQPASRGANSPPKPGFGALAPATSSVALSTGCDRAHLWRSKTAERRLPFSGPGGAASGIALDPLGSPSLPCGRESRSPPGRVACPLRDRLPIQVEGPSDVNPPVRLARAGHSRVRFFLRGLCCPLQGVVTPPATSPSEPSLRCRRPSRHETPQHLYPVLSSGRAPFREPGPPSDRRSFSADVSPGSPEPVDEFILPGPRRKRKGFFKMISNQA